MARGAGPVKAALVWLHKWLGVTLALLFLMWFLSGLVLYFVPFPNLGQAERLAALPELPASGPALMTAQEAASRNGLRFSEARLGMLDGRPVWRLLAGSPAVWTVVDAVDASRVAPLDAAHARTVAEAFSGRHAVGAEPIDRDQWTVPQGLNPYRPLFKIALDGDDGLELYVSAGAAEVVRDTRRAERFWNWVGAVPHWIYPTVLRQFPLAWNRTVVWLSIPGVVLAASGLALGVWQLFLNRSRWIPYRKFWMRWHHIAGLAAGVVTLSWIFSGLMSMNPFDVFSPRGATAAERGAWAGAPAVATLRPDEALAVARGHGLAARELELLQVGGHAWYRLRDAEDSWLLPADANAPAEAVRALPDALLQPLMSSLRPRARTPQIERLSAYDDLYYSRDPQSAEARFNRPLPVWRLAWPDGVTIYADPASARLLLRVDDSGRWQRLFYNGLHSFDFAPLMARPWLRHLLVVGFSLLGTALCLTSCVIAWRVLVSAKPAKRR
ncbi:hypothetical protein GT347_26410 [Xylophilus rhododendri]|uniref:PepSY domain-containing protein n=1 Tax=Xylophilus rhododendri TaxID=2697032 RepID=A0A857JDM2_9BURK|nr:PepSY domain-containing protein [Xylophilus rhododendri]QHJ01210.1 hypothetical protein GT347_26410 [Xylophilus rhododendri]